MFTFRMEPQVIRMHEPGQKVVQENCIRCHSDLLERTTAATGMPHGMGRQCWECHREIPHGRVNSLASAPHARVPIPDPVRMPEWMLGDKPPLITPTYPQPKAQPLTPNPNETDR
jgi:cytochrome c nitrite reductase small subunit